MKKSKKKSTPEGALISGQDYRTTSGIDIQHLAGILFEAIGDMWHPVRRPKDEKVDRAFRRMIEEANMKGDCIINLGEGYYRPDPGDDFDYSLYRARELAKAKRIIDKITAMDAYYRREI